MTEEKCHVSRLIDFKCIQGTDYIQVIEIGFLESMSTWETITALKEDNPEAIKEFIDSIKKWSLKEMAKKAIA